MVVEGVVRLDEQPAPAGDHPRSLRDRQHPEEAAIVTACARLARDGEDLEGAAEIEHIDVGEDEDADGARCGEFGVPHAKSLAAKGAVDSGRSAHRTSRCSV